MNINGVHFEKVNFTETVDSDDINLELTLLEKSLCTDKDITIVTRIEKFDNCVAVHYVVKADNRSDYENIGHQIKIDIAIRVLKICVYDELIEINEFKSKYPKIFKSL